MGYDTGASATAIIPVMIGDEVQTALLWRALFEGGVFVNTVVPPAVPPRQSCLRTSYMATHTDEQLEYILGAFRQAQAQVRAVG
jgi:7-keto-8-aminopelargonate synthetase-like enzyme